MHMPARCFECGLTFPGDGGIKVSGNASIRMHNNFITCPRCGSDARLVDGEFEFSDGQVEVISAPEWSRDVLREILTNAMNAEDPIAAIEKNDHRLGSLLRRATSGWSRSDIISLIGVIVAVLSLYVAAAEPDPGAPVIVPAEQPALTPEQIESLVEGAVRRVREEGPREQEAPSRSAASEPNQDVPPRRGRMR